MPTTKEIPRSLATSDYLPRSPPADYVRRRVPVSFEDAFTALKEIVDFAKKIAVMPQDGEVIGAGAGVPFIMENDSAVKTLNELISAARALVSHDARTTTTTFGS